VILRNREARPGIHGRVPDWTELRPLPTDVEVMRYITAARHGPMSRSVRSWIVSEAVFRAKLL